MFRKLYPPNFHEGALGAHLSVRLLATAAAFVATFAHIWGEHLCEKAEKHFVEMIGSTDKLPSLPHFVLEMVRSPWWDLLQYAPLAALGLAWVMRPAWIAAVTALVLFLSTTVFLCVAPLGFWITDMGILKGIEQKAREKGLLEKPAS